MKQQTFLWIFLCLVLSMPSNFATATAAKPTYLLQSSLRAGDSAVVEASLEVGGDMLVKEDNAADGKAASKKTEKKLPLSVVAKLRYEQRFLAWSSENNSVDNEGADNNQVARSLRYYDLAQATIKVDESGMERTLPEDQRLVLAEVRGSQSVLNGLQNPMTRDALDLIQIVGNTLAIDRLLPGKEQAEGDSWQHGQDTIGALLGMDHVAVCEVSSIVTGVENRQVQIRMASVLKSQVRPLLDQPLLVLLALLRQLMVLQV